MSETQTPANEDFLRDFVELQRKVADISNASVSGNQLATGDVIGTFQATRTGCLLMDGSTIFDTDWPALTAYIRANLAALIIDGVSVRLPDARGYVLGGAGGSGFVLGTATGVTAVTLTSTQSGQPGIAAGTTGAGSAHSHTVPASFSALTFTWVTSGGGSSGYLNSGTQATSSESAHTHSTPAVAAASAAASHTNVQPTLPLNWFIKT